jgi:mono/diheme cytochrome c family protein
MLFLRDMEFAMKLHLVSVVTGIALGFTIPAASQTAGTSSAPPEVGRALAERWCVSCHVIDRAQRSGAANGVPTFPAIAAKPTTTEASLRGVLSQPHGRMPDFSIGRHDQDALIAYILSLR